MPKTKSILLLILILFIFSISLWAESNRYIQAKVYFDNKLEYQSLMALGLDLYKRGDNYFEIILNQTEYDQISGDGYKIDIVHDDISAFLQSRLLPDKDMGGYKTLDEIYTHLDSIIAANPTLVSPRTSIGQTIEGRDMW
ncbi:MAG: hypothetical protein ABIJ45_12135, partial [Candidatus Zixiibacteriota bacterium]